MMTIQEIGVMLDILEANYGQKFYDGVNRDNVLKLWASSFQNDDPKIVMQAVQKYISTMSYKPTIADIRKRMVQVQLMTEIEVFQSIKNAVRMANDDESACKAFNELPGICRKIVIQPSQLRAWRMVSSETFETVIASMISRSYRILADREAEYYSLPPHMKKDETWRIQAPELVSLPGPKRQKTFEEMDLEREQAEIEYRKRYGIKTTPEMVERNRKKLTAFIQPMTAEELKTMKQKEKLKFEQKVKEWSMGR